MKKFLTLALIAFLCTPAFAQKMGSRNRNAPTIKQSIAVGGQTISFDYTSIAWGNTVEMVMDKDKGAEARAMVNQMAERAPLATFTTSADCKCGDLALPAGEYKVSFTVSDECVWSLNFKGKDDKSLSLKLDLMDTPQESKRLLLCLYAGDDEGAGLYVSFGKKMCMLNFMPSKDKK
ncbi:MAG: hypothetical protein U1E73_05075 [Planctomycetota bacterium]